MQDQSVPVDGRAARALRTRESIVDACVALVEEGELRPTAPRIAQRAGVSVRSIFQHFADLPSLHLAVSRRVAERMAVLARPVDAGLPLDRRIDAFVGDRATLLEAITPFRRAAHVHGPFSPEIRTALREASAYLRRGVDQAFAPELGRLPDGQRRVVADAIAAAVSWGAWDAMRHEWGRSAEEATAVLSYTVRVLVADGAASR